MNSKTVSSEDLSFNSLQNNVFNSVKNNFINVCGLNTFACNGTSFTLNKSSKRKKCFVCGSKFHLIKDCNFHEQRMGVCASQNKPRPMWKNVNDIPPYTPQETHKTSKHNYAD